MKSLNTLALVFILVASVTSVSAAPKAPASGNNWSSTSVISGLNQPDPTRGSQENDVAVNASGVALAAWDQFQYTATGPYTVGAAVQTGGRWGAPFTISGTTGFSQAPRVAVGADGTMAVSWTWQDVNFALERVQVAVKPAGASAWATTTLAEWVPGGVAIIDFVPVAIDATGNLTVVWSAWNGSRHLLQSATLPKGGAWSPAVTIAGTVDAVAPSLSVNARGDAAVVFCVSPYTSYSTGTNAQYAFRSGVGGSWSVPVAISETLSSSVGYVSGAKVTLDANGLATAIYIGYGIEATRQLPSGAWTTPRAALQWPSSTSAMVGLDLASDRLGRSLLVASFLDGPTGATRATVFVTTGAADGVWSAPKRLTDPTAAIDAYSPRAAVSPDGTLAMVGWIDHYHGNVQVSQLNAGAWSTANTIGRGTAFSSFQEVLALDAGSGAVARAIWKNAKGGTQTMAASYGK